MANYLVTGGAGFIGHHLVDRLVADGHSVRVLDNFITGKRTNLDAIRQGFELLEGDFRDPEVCRRACADIEVIFHIGALPSVPNSIADPQASHDCNMNGTFNMLQAAVRCKCRRLVYAASSSAYGDIDVSPKVETLKPEPKSPYAVQKLAGELYARSFYECFGLETLALRYFNVFGPRQDPASQYAAAIPAFVTAILGDRPPTIYGDGEQTRDFTYIDNVVQANVLAAQAERTRGEAVNAACGASISLNAIVGMINQALGKDVKPVYADWRPGDVRDSLADNRKAKALIGYEPLVEFADGLSRTIAFYQSAAKDAS
ncbi:MAG: SDR family oxidoreductase [bacterium]|nr:SDR family oxidoreductase [bacterium]